MSNRTLFPAFVSGMAVAAAPSLAFAAFDQNLRYGDQGAAVSALQAFLNGQGLFAADITGNFYSKTLAAVKAFQTREAVLPISGYFGPLTRGRANAVLSKSAETSASQTPTDKTAGQFEGSLRNRPDHSWSLLMSFGKDVALYPLQFTMNSICVIGPDEGPCVTLLSNFNNGGANLGGGDNVSVVGHKQDNYIIVRKLILNENFVMNGTLIVEGTAESRQKMWSLLYQPPIGDSAVQNPSRPTNTIPLKFDGKSVCGDTVNINCDLNTLHQNDGVFVRGIKYRDQLIVRMLTSLAKAPSTLPR